MHVRYRAALGLIWLVCLANVTPDSPVRAQDTPADQGGNPPAATEANTVDYDTEVKPVLQQFCVRCHGPEEQNAGLRLDTAVGLNAGGDSGPALTIGQPDESRFIQAMKGVDGVSEMPPEGEPRPTAEQIERLVQWVRLGAIAPVEEPQAATVTRNRDHWSFQPIRRPSLPAVRRTDWPLNAIDYFILAELEKKGMAPSSEADRYTLIRRASLDLIGLPPTIEETQRFIDDPRGDAYQRMIDRLLDSPHYGERWGRRWLDLARYADSNGYTRDMPRTIWPYRDWVINAINRNLPFDQFVIEQLAGDLLPNATLDQQVATGFHRNTLFNEEGGTDPEQFRVERTVDRVNTTGAVLLGMTIGCAQCHDHKYDPISQREYYQLFAFFNTAEEPQLDVPTPQQIADGDVERRATIRARIEELNTQFAALKEEYEKSEIQWEASLTEEQKKELPFQVLNAVQLARADRTEELNGHLYDYYSSLPEVRQQFPVLDEIYQLKQQEPKFDNTMVMCEQQEPRETFVMLRGDFLNPGVRVTANTPAVLPPLNVSGDRPTRLDLAQWLMSADNPLTARVAVNRVWQQHFGRGIVETENDFGLQGERPTHPELLDWLAAEFIASGWDMKALHRLIVTSATYRQQSYQSPEALAADPRNELLGRQNRLRLDSELIRDSALCASGLLANRIGGPSVYPPQPEGVFDFTQDKKPWPTEVGANRWRRAMYTYLWRSSPYPALSVFDFPDANVTCTRRIRSNTPLQSLTLANDATFVEFARGLARNLLAEPSGNDAQRLTRAFRRTLTRPPHPRELERLEQFLGDQRALYASDTQAAAQLASGMPEGPVPDAVELAAWTATARVLLNLDEFITRE